MGIIADAFSLPSIQIHAEGTIDEIFAKVTDYLDKL